MKRVAVLGITGSIGTSTIEVLRQHPDQFELVFASTHNNYQKFFQYCDEFDLCAACITNEALKTEIKEKPENLQLYFGTEELQKIISSLECDIVVNAISGSAGLRSSITIASAGIDLALANKESLVMAGHILTNSSINITPVDSEHSAILQAIGSNPPSQVKSVTLTASGGPFRQLPLNEFKNITLKEALDHPTWNMGAKITIDSATMMNKALEVIEAHWLFDKDFSEIHTVIHPQSIIHSFVEFIDGSIIAQMSFPTMKIPILYALTHPDHIKSDLAKTNILNFPNLSFEEVSAQRYPLFFLACEAGRKGGILPTIVNAANEAAIKLFTDSKIRFDQIAILVESVIDKADNISEPIIEDILQANKFYYQKTLKDYKTLF